MTDGITSSEKKNEGVRKSVLVQANTTVDNSGHYKCFATYKTDDSSSVLGTVEKSVSVVIRGFTIQPIAVRQRAGVDAVLTCAVRGDREAAITW